MIKYTTKPQEYISCLFGYTNSFTI